MSLLWLWRPTAADAALLAQRTPIRGDRLDMILVFADLATFAAYAVIPLVILYFLARRRHVHFSRVWFLLLAYLTVGGAVHILDACGDWGPAVQIGAALKVVVAFISWVWVIVLIPLVPQLFELRSAEEFTTLVSKHEEAEQALKETEAVYKSLI